MRYLGFSAWFPSLFDSYFISRIVCIFMPLRLGPVGILPKLSTLTSYTCSTYPLVRTGHLILPLNTWITTLCFYETFLDFASFLAPLKSLLWPWKSPKTLLCLQYCIRVTAQSDLPAHEGLTVSNLSSVTSQLASLDIARFLQAAWLTPRDILYIRPLCYSGIRWKRSEKHFEKA